MDLGGEEFGVQKRKECLKLVDLVLDNDDCFSVLCPCLCL